MENREGIVLIELGNTVIKVALCEHSDIRSVERYPIATPELALNAVERLAKNAHAIALAASGPEPVGFVDALEMIRPTLRLSTALPTPLQSAYRSMHTLGIDRFANAVMACESNPNGTTLVIDLGTCVTYDLTVGCRYEGGAIAPGLFMRAKAMHANTARLPEITLPLDAPLVGQTTEGSLQAGTLHGWRAEINGMIEAYRENQANLTVISTGGDLPYFEAVAKSGIFADPFWTLKGYYQIYRLHAL